MLLLSSPRMLVFLLLALIAADSCEGKAFREETAKDRGKRSYTQNSGIYQTYGSQSNAGNWNFYEPGVAGQPIYVPSVDQQGSYQEFLDAYYKTYTEVRNPVTPAPVYGTDIDKNFGTSKAEKSASLVYGTNVPEPSKESLSKISSPDDYSVPESEEYDAPEVVDKAIATELGNKNDNLVPEVQDQDEYDEPVLLDSLKASDSPMTKPEHDSYDQPIKIKQKSKTHSKKDSPKKTISKTKPQSDEYGNKKPSVQRVKQNKKPVSSTPKYGDRKRQTTKKSKGKRRKQYAKPEVEEAIDIDDISAQRTEVELSRKDQTTEVRTGVKNKPVKTKESVKNPQYKPTGTKEKFAAKTITKDKPVKTKVVERDPQYQSIGKGKVRAKPGTKDKPVKTKVTVQHDPQYESEVEKVVAVKQTSKDKPIKDNVKYDEVDSGTNVPEPSKDGLSKVSSPDDYSVPEFEEYDTPEVVDKAIETEFSNEDNLVSEVQDQDEPVLLDSLKESDSPMTKPEHDSYDQPIKIKQKSKTHSKKDSPKKTISKTKDKPVKTEVVERDQQYQSIEKEKVSAKPGTKDKPVKVTIQRDPQYRSKVEKVVAVKQTSKDKPIKDNVKCDEVTIADGQLSNDQDVAGNTDNPLEEYDFTDDLDTTEKDFSERKLNLEELATEIVVGPENSEFSAVEKPDFVSPNDNDFRGLAMNSNIWSMLFNPNAEQNRLKQQRCITRSNETGFCTYIQNCDVPQIATSLEQLLNNACVIDEIFIGVCCPEFPVQTIKVQWDETPSDFDNQIEDEFGHNDEDCGIRSNEASEMQSWPWKAPLVSMSNGKIFCGGVLVSEDHVLTAAHCTTKIPKNQILVRIGQFDDASGDDYAVIEIKRHAQYNPRTMQNDVALLKLGRRIKNGAHVGPLCLPEEDDDNDDHDGETATLLGWRGIFGTNSRDPEFLEVMSNEKCAEKLGRKISNSLLCTETRKESGRTCNADSGAPLVIEDDDKYEVIGILSWNRNDCDPRFPSTLSRVSSYTGWIKKHLS